MNILTIPEKNFHPSYYRITCEELNYSSGWIYKNLFDSGTNLDSFNHVKKDIEELFN